MTEVRKKQDKNVDRRLEPTAGTEPNNAANLLQVQTGNPMWLWAVLGIIVITTVIIGILFGGDGGYS